MSRMKSRSVRFTEGLFGGILGLVLSLIVLGIYEAPTLTPRAAVVGIGAGLGIGVLVTRAWRK